MAALPRGTALAEGPPAAAPRPRPRPRPRAEGALGLRARFPVCAGRAEGEEGRRPRPRVLASRAAYLQLFCQAILNDPHALGSSRVCAFFGLDEHIWHPVRSYDETSSAPSSVGSSSSLASLDQLEEQECPP